MRNYCASGQDPREGELLMPETIQQTTNIIVIDVSSEELRRLLHRDGHAVEMAHDGESGLGAVRRSIPDLVLLDLLSRLLVTVREEAARRRSLLAISTEAERTLFNAHWKGNLRELRTLAERASMPAEGDLIADGELVGVATAPARAAASVRVAAPQSQATAPQSQDGDELGLKTVERDHIVRVLERSRGNKKAAAELLGISRRKLYRYLEEYRLHIPHKALGVGSSFSHSA